ncbi:DASH family cryptochrome [uncultured Tenacibaculum sp.]|uniref:DASH family cryptochrome n=1 Tax=uncultured Tenacibaculum sp. TaxID=174713 RepID=UPI00260BDD02|nr:DASH family cryptochrome [uncultured Tenacibaculum sp.]
MQQDKTAIVWFTNTLRTRDNKALYEAISKYNKVIAVYCFDKSMFETQQFGFKKTEKYRAKFLIESVTDLSNQLKELNVPFYIHHEHPHVILPLFCLTHNADALLYQKEFTQEETSEINRVLDKLPDTVYVESFYDQFLYHPEDIPIDIKSIPEVFTVFRKRVEKYAIIREELIPVAMPKENYQENDTRVPTLQDLGYSDFEVPVKTAFPFKGGETAAFERLNSYFFSSKKLSYYKKTRNGLIGVDYSSKFSPWLAHGCISAKSIYWEVKKYEKQFGSNQSTYWLIFELIWRDYFKYLSLKHENNLFKLEGIKELSYSWKNNERLIQNWINGETNEPFVNANMIELKETGWMSNRGRQNVASYFAKELLLDWRIGAAYFESMLIDYDVHSNYGNWQYVSGVGNDPRDRKFNVQLQAERYDANGKYQQMWLQPTLF